MCLHCVTNNKSDFYILLSCGTAVIEVIYASVGNPCFKMQVLEHFGLEQVTNFQTTILGFLRVYGLLYPFEL